MEHTYVQLAEFFKHTLSSKGRAKFTAAMDEISTAYTEECSGDVIVPDTITELAESFRELMRSLRLNTINTEDLSQARSIYGKFLCYSESDQEDVVERVKRQDPVVYRPVTTTDASPTTEDPEANAECQNVTECNCPEIITEPCHFFACLEVSEIRFICGFGNGLSEEPCIGFLVDTSGSMEGEIEAAKRVIFQFLKSQADSTACYILLPFNDFDYDHYAYHGYSEEDSK